MSDFSVVDWGWSASEDVRKLARRMQEMEAEIERLRGEVKQLRAKEQLTKDLFNHHGNDGSLV